MLTVPADIDAHPDATECNVLLGKKSTTDVGNAVALFFALQSGHYQLAVGSAVTRNMPGKCMHIFNPLGLPARRPVKRN